MQILVAEPGAWAGGGECCVCTVSLEPAHGMRQGKAFGGRRAAPCRQAPLGPFAELIA